MLSISQQNLCLNQSVNRLDGATNPRGALLILWCENSSAGQSVIDDDDNKTSDYSIWKSSRTLIALTLSWCFSTSSFSLSNHPGELAKRWPHHNFGIDKSNHNRSTL
jgi:hypothetical protein